MTQASANVNVMIKAARKAGAQPAARLRRGREPAGLGQGAGRLRQPRRHSRPRRSCATELAEARPNYGWLGEESGEAKGADPTRRWIVDPLDGTTNFLHGLPHWAVSIGLEHKGEVVAGVVYDPVKDEMFVAEKGAGAWLNDRRLRVSGRREMLEMVFATGIPFGGAPTCRGTLRELAALTPRTAGIRRWGVGGARPRLRRRRPVRRLLGARPQALGRGGRAAAGARGRRLRRHRSRATATPARAAASSPPTPTSSSRCRSCCARPEGRRPGERIPASGARRRATAVPEAAANG